jgi:hypothetical protein
MKIKEACRVPGALFLYTCCPSHMFEWGNKRGALGSGNVRKFLIVKLIAALATSLAALFSIENLTQKVTLASDVARN